MGYFNEQVMGMNIKIATGKGTGLHSLFTGKFHVGLSSEVKDRHHLKLPFIQEEGFVFYFSIIPELLIFFNLFLV